MKRYYLTLFALTSIFVLSALAQTPSPSPAISPTPIPTPSLGAVLLGIFDLVKSWKDLGMYAGISAALKLLIDGIKAAGIWDKIPSKLQGLAVLLVSTLTVGLAVMASGGTLLSALSSSLGSGAGSMLLFEIWKDLFPPKAQA